MESGCRVNYPRLELGSQGQTVMQFLFHIEVAQGTGLWSLPAAAIDYVTCPASHFLHSQLKGAVWKYPHVLKD